MMSFCIVTARSSLLRKSRRDMSDVVSQRAKYQKAFATYGPSPQALFWNSYASAALRYRALTSDFDFRGTRVLDVGCGFGDIIPFVASHAPDVLYTGIDIVPEFVHEAAQRYPDFHFDVADYMQESYRFSADYILCSGAFNYHHDDALGLRKEVLERMFHHASRGVAMSMSGGVPQPKNSRRNQVSYVDAREVLAFCFSLTPRVIFRNDYHDKDFTVVLFK